MKVVHPNCNRFLCNFRRKCRRWFSSIDEFENHTNSHVVNGRSNVRNLLTTKYVSELDEAMKCFEAECKGKQFGNRKVLEQHINSGHFSRDTICIYENCDFLLKSGSRFRDHFRRKHNENRTTNLKPIYLVSPSLTINTNLSVVEDYSEEVPDSGDYTNPRAVTMKLTMKTMIMRMKNFFS